MPQQNKIPKVFRGYVSSDVNGDGVTDGSDNSIVDNNAFNFVSKITP